MIQTTTPHIDRALLNPKFDGFKLSTQLLAVTAAPLPRPLSGLLPACPFRLLELFGRLNRLTAGPDGRSALFVDGRARAVMLVDLHDTLRVTQLHALQAPDPAGSPGRAAAAAASARLRHPPSVVLATPRLMLVSDGVGSLEVFELDAASRSATRLASVHSPRRSELPTHGMFVWAACELADGELLVCVQSAFEVDTGAAPGSHRPSKQIRFMLDLLRVQIPRHHHSHHHHQHHQHHHAENQNGDQMHADYHACSKNVIADVVMSLQGDSAPYFVQIEPDEPAICVGAPSAFEPLIVATDADPSAALSSDIVPSVAPGSVAEVPDAMLVAGDVAAIPALPPYAWSQAGDEVTVYVHLARAPVDKTDLRILFHDSRISVRSLRSETPLLEGPLFDSIQSSECLWTLERSHLITLYMPKRNANTRWPHLFEHDDGVLETLDSNTLAEFRERMAKYHGPGDGAASPQRAAFRAAGSAAADAADDTMLGGSAHTRFQTVTERQESVDFEGASFCVGRFAVLQAHAGEHTRKRSHFASDSRCSSPHAPAAVRCAQTHQSLMPGLTWLGPVLGVPPTDPTQGSEADPAGFVAQSDVDGLVFGLASQMRFAHVGTVSALGFVQASKRDKKLVCVSRDVAYAFVLESRQYLYIYERDQPGQATARQLVVDLAAAAAAAGSDAGAVLGMAQLGPTEQAKLRLNREQEDGGAIGAGHWEQQRQAWRASHRPYDPQAAASQAFRSHPALVDVNETHYEAVYQSLITGRRFTQGVPLSFVTTILIHGWRKEGMVPMDWPPLAPGEGSR
ncbi:hypothetical protein HK105_205634 [Polyrhizophydium stewartii]|uniref:NudC domain-containing protein 1 n=1 Tax=Polyrhizophydium stewartii TaxID=2732419 RepID=A0ABR4N5V3_9FUNG